MHGYHETVLESMDDLGCAGDGCGCLVKFRLRFDDSGRIRQAHFWSREIGGNGPAFEFAQTLASACIGKNIIEASALGKMNLPHTEADQVMVAEDAFHHALGVYAMSLMSRDADSREGDSSILVAMSGGVDSAVCLYRANDMADGNVMGCTLRLWIDPAGPDPDRACCAPESVRRARHTCHKMGKGHLSLDMRAKFKAAIVDSFVADYAAGETPNPCVRCNGHFRLDELVACANALGFDRVATGHYVRTVERDGVFLVQRGVDANKDQSYMLSDVSPDTIARYAFPLGPDTKPQIRAEAAALGLEQAKIKGSQEVCFLGGGNYRDFLARAKAQSTSGNITLPDGTVVGSHDGISGFTPGQRKGVPVDFKKIPNSMQTLPLFVKTTDPASGDVVIAPRDQAMTKRVPIRNLKMYADPVGEMTLQVRYRAGRTPLRGKIAADGAAFICEDEVFAVAAGQIAVVYDADEVVVGKAFISRERPAAQGASKAA